MKKNKLKITPELYDELKELSSSIIEDGYEVPCPKPKEVNLTIRPPSLQSQIQRLVRTAVSQQVADQGAETWDEANDFDIPEEDDPISPYIVHDMIEEEPVADPAKPSTPSVPEDTELPEATDSTDGEQGNPPPASP